MSAARPEVRVLDLGFGKGAQWKGAQLPRNVKLTGVDMCADWLQEALIPRPENIVEGLVPEVLRDFDSRSYDLVMAFDLIEHLPRHEGMLMIYEMQRIASDTAVIFTPNGTVWQPPSIDNPFNAHVSGWTPREFRRLGWTEIYGWGGLKPLVGPYGAKRYNPSGRAARRATRLAYRAGRTSVALPVASFSFSAVVRTGITGYSPLPADAWDRPSTDA